jgi:hypothetical protein
MAVYKKPHYKEGSKFPHSIEFWEQDDWKRKGRSWEITNIPPPSDYNDYVYNLDLKEINVTLNEFISFRDWGPYRCYYDKKRKWNWTEVKELLRQIDYDRWAFR